MIPYAISATVDICMACCCLQFISFPRLAQDPEAKLIKVSQTMSKACSFECWIWQVLFCHFVSVPNQPLSLNILAMKCKPMCTIHSKSLLTESNTGPTLDLCRGLMCLVQIRMKGRNAFGSCRLPCIASLQAGVFLIIFQCFSSSWGIMSGSSSCGSRWTDSTAHTSWCWCFHCCHCFSSCLICFDPMMHTRTRAHWYTWSFNQNPARNWESGRRFQDDRQLFLGRSTRRKRAVMVRPTGNDMLEKIPLRFCHMNQPESFLASQQSNFPGGTSEQCHNVAAFCLLVCRCLFAVPGKKTMLSRLTWNSRTWSRFRWGKAGWSGTPRDLNDFESRKRMEKACWEDFDKEFFRSKKCPNQCSKNFTFSHQLILVAWASSGAMSWTKTPDFFLIPVKL